MLGIGVYGCNWMYMVYDGAFVVGSGKQTFAADEQICGRLWKHTECITRRS